MSWVSRTQAEEKRHPNSSALGRIREVAPASRIEATGWGDRREAANGPGEPRVARDDGGASASAQLAGLAPTLLITATEAATIFQADDEVYRNDLPLSGITHGWAIPAIVEQARQLFAETWPEIEVVVDAPEPELEALIRAFVVKGAAAYPADTVREQPLPVPDDLGGPQPGSGTAAVGRFGVFHLALVVVVLLIAGLSWWAIAATTAAPVGQESARRVPGERDAAVRSSTPAPSAPANSAPAEGPAEPTMLHELDTARLVTPAGYRARSDDGAWVLEGPDPDSRIRVVIEPTHGVPKNLVLDALREGIAHDPQLAPAPAPDSAPQAVSYTEQPGDGSQTTWASWVDAGFLISVGCQTRTSATYAQRGACALVWESVSIEEQRAG
ncbi:hypothetical protein CATYP_02260 [Corynebacterium atypicum]|uniref:Type VII secretion-associated protein n=1 Tax=Corynebacterium atypicum TaxID=191610 RepID=A0ABN4DBE5_9CORY|nr:type VII secretion-associated protein [Corynebacterium atypicum]AIG63698.1 hypothetical protein CATYP_02260 [Corynebacterium atypicum]